MKRREAKGRKNVCHLGATALLILPYFRFLVFILCFCLFQYFCKPHVIMERVDSVSGPQLPPSADPV